MKKCVRTDLVSFLNVFLLLVKIKPDSRVGLMLSTWTSFQTPDTEDRNWLDPMCCSSYVLSQEPDFTGKKEWLTEVVNAAGFNIIFFPKYHCELNFIEMIWGWVKGHHRRTCTYNYADLKKRLPETFLDVIPLAFIRRAARCASKVGVHEVSG